MFIGRDGFLYCLSYELSKMAAFCSIRKIENGREPLGYKHFVPNGTFPASESRLTGATGPNPTAPLSFSADAPRKSVKLRG